MLRFDNINYCVRLYEYTDLSNRSVWMQICTSTSFLSSMNSFWLIFRDGLFSISLWTFWYAVLFLSILVEPVTTDVNTTACEVKELGVEIPQSSDLQSQMPQDNYDRSQLSVDWNRLLCLHDIESYFSTLDFWEYPYLARKNANIIIFN